MSDLLCSCGDPTNFTDANGAPVCRRCCERHPNRGRDAHVSTLLHPNGTAIAVCGTDWSALMARIVYEEHRETCGG